MNITIFICVLVFISLNAINHAEECVPSNFYYWRDYYTGGEVPPDAYEAGKDKHGNPVYVGQAYIRNYELLTATIYPKLYARTNAYGKILTTKDHIKILCTPFPNSLQWVNTKIENMDKISNLIPGGSEVGADLKIGRAFRNGGAFIAKVFDNSFPNKGGWFFLENQRANLMEFEVLRFNCSGTIDVRYF